MKPEDKVCTQEQSRQLVKLGLILQAEKYWNRGGLLSDFISKAPGIDSLIEGGYLPALDVSELDLILNSSGFSVNYEDTIVYQSGYEYWWNLESISNDHIPDVNASFYCKTAAQAKANAVIWLISNKYIEPGGLGL